MRVSALQTEAATPSDNGGGVALLDALKDDKSKLIQMNPAAAYSIILLAAIGLVLELNQDGEIVISTPLSRLTITVDVIYLLSPAENMLIDSEP